MIADDPFPDDDGAYPLSFRQSRHALPRGAPPAGRFETNGRQKLFASARRRRKSAGPFQGMHLRGNRKAAPKRA